MSSVKKSVGPSAVELFDASSTNPTDRRVYRVVNLGPDTVYLDNTSSVTSSNGFPLDSGDEEIYHFELERESRTFKLYGITASGKTADVRVWEMLLWA